LRDFLDTTGQLHPNPDLVWRTSGEYRSSGFLPLQAAYAELVFTTKYCPEIDESDVAEAILEYSARVRRFGGGGLPRPPGRRRARTYARKATKPSRAHANRGP